MINIQDVLKIEFAYLETFTKRINTAWGSIFCNESQPNYYDANHAHINDAYGNPQLVIDEVTTIEEVNGKGLIGEIIQFIQKEVMNRGIDKLWVFPINESIEKVYQKYGFETVDKMNIGHAFLGGKSIKEIQGE